MKRRPNQASRRRLAHQALDRAIDYARDRRKIFAVRKLSALYAEVLNLANKAAQEEER